MRIFFEKSAQYIEGFLDCCINLLKRGKWIDCILQWFFKSLGNGCWEMRCTRFLILKCINILCWIIILAKLKSLLLKYSQFSKKNKKSENKFRIASSWNKTQNPYLLSENTQLFLFFLSVMNLTIKSYLEGIKTHQFSAKEVVNHYLQKAKLLNPKLNACVRFNQNYID